MFLLCSYLLMPIVKPRIVGPMVSSQTRMFRLTDGGVSCDREGFFIGLVPLLAVEKGLAGVKVWVVRDEQALNDELSACYGLPIDSAAKRSGLAGVAAALNRGDVVLAAIAALLLQFPDPQPLGKGVRSLEDEVRLAADLFWSSLLKGEWDPSKHPRTEEPPNPGWFAPVPKEETTPESRRGWPPPIVNKAFRNLVARIAERGPLIGVAALGPIAEATILLYEVLNSTPLNEGEDERLAAQWRANLDPPKTFEELQKQPIDDILGYDQHHVVERNPDNLERRDLEKFTSAVIEDPDNLVWIPRLKHEQITSYYNSKPNPSGLRQRDIINALMFDEQRAIGLKQLRDRGILK